MQRIMKLLALSAVVVVAIATEGQAATISGTVASVPDSDFNLTTLGTTDWAYWAGTSPVSLPTNDKTGGTLIGDMSVVGGGTLSGSSSSNKPIYDFDFTDGTSPVSGTADNVEGRFSDAFNAVGAGVTLDVTLSTVAEHTIYVWAAGFAVDEGTFTATLSDATNFVDTTLVASGFSPKDSYLYTLTATPETAGDILNISLVLTDDGSVDFSHVIISGVAVSVAAVPEPSSLALWSLLSVLGMSCVRRRRS